MNESLFFFVNSFAGTHPVRDAIIVWITRHGIQSMLVVWAILVLVSFFKTRDPLVQLKIIGEGLRMGGSVFFVWLCMWCIKVLVALPRPFEILYGVQQLVQESSRTSFPSSHSAISFAIATSAYYAHPRLGKVFFVVATCIALSRLYVGVHYPLDILVGGVFGYAIATVFHKIITQKVK